MTGAPSRAVRLFGTEETVPPPRTLAAGRLTAELESGNLRYIRFCGAEMIRAISFIVRDRNWGTCTPRIDNLLVAESDAGFAVSYAATVSADGQEFRYSVRISGHPDGRLRFEATGHAITDFLTNRTGFVVLHPIAGVAGAAARTEDVEGRVAETRFPDRIDPAQPMMNLRAITHSFAPGVFVTCRMEGDAYEMEDQRNWTDASFKTYVRPLARPWPYLIAQGSEIAQSVALMVTGTPAVARSEQAISVRLGEQVGRMPMLGLGLDPDEAEAASTRIPALRQARPAHLVCRHDPRRGHDRRVLRQAVDIAHALGATPWLEAVIAEVDDFEREIASLGETVRSLGVAFPVVLVSPATDLKSTSPGGTWPPCPPAEALYRATRKAFPAARLGGGMFSTFTELNRKRPPLHLLDFVDFTTASIVHAADDRSVMESLEALPHIVRSLRSFIGNHAYAVGPSAIGMRDNPYGATPLENAENIRQTMSRNDPRQRGLLGAAWALGYFAHFAYGGAEAIALGGTVGAFGIVHAPTAFPQPWFDTNGGLFPVFHVVRGLSRLSGRSLRRVEISHPREIQALATASDDGKELWLANLTGEAQRIALDPAITGGMVAVLDSESFVTESERPDAMENRSQPFSGTTLELDAYAVACIRSH